MKMPTEFDYEREAREIDEWLFYSRLAEEAEEKEDATKD